MMEVTSRVVLVEPDLEDRAALRASLMAGAGDEKELEVVELARLDDVDLISGVAGVLVGPGAAEESEGWLKRSVGTSGVARLPVVVVTAAGRGGLAEALWKAGAMEAWARPDLTPEGLGRSLRHSIERHRLILRLEGRDAFRRQVANLLVAFTGVMEPDGTLTEANDPALALGNLRPEDVLGRKFWETWWWSHDPVLMGRLRDACTRAAAGETVRFDALVRVVDDAGEEGRLEIDFQIAPLRDKAGHVTHLIPSAVDITQRKAVEAALRESGDRFRTLADNMSQLAWMADAAGGLFWYNKRWYDFTGMIFEEMEGWGWQRVHHRDHVERVTGGYRAAVEAGAEWEDVFPLRRHDGVYRWFLSRAMPIRDEDGAVVRWFGTNTDITEQLEAEVALRRSEAHYRTTFENAAVGVARVGLDGRWLEVNQRLCQITGYDREALLQGTFEDLTHPDDLSRDWEQARRLLAGEIDTYSMEKRYRRPEGDWLWINLTVSLVRDDDGEPLHFVSVVEDIRARKDAEAAVQRAKAELERRVEARTEELRTRALQLGRLSSELTLTEQRERRRLARVLHDHLQQELIAAKLGLAVLPRDLEEAAGPGVAQARQSLEAAIEVSRNLTVELSPPILSEAGLKAALEWLARWMMEKRGLEVEVWADAVADPEREDVAVLIFESVRELLQNVVKHSGVKRALVEAQLDESGGLRVVVEDRGRGFDPAMVVEGCGGHGGFGLMSIRERLDLLGGRMSVQSRTGGGARFLLEVPPESKLSAPLAVQAGTVAEEEVPAVERREADDGRQRPIRILIADDHEVMRRGLTMLMGRAADLEVVGEAVDGMDAVEQVRRLQPEVVVMDFSMPRLNGVEATRLVHAEFPEIAVIGFSMYEQQDRAEAMMRAGARAYVSKSEDASLLLSRIREVAGGVAGVPGSDGPEAGGGSQREDG